MVYNVNNYRDLIRYGKIEYDVEKQLLSTYDYYRFMIISLDNNYYIINMVNGECVSVNKYVKDATPKFIRKEQASINALNSLSSKDLKYHLGFNNLSDLEDI